MKFHIVQRNDTFESIAKRYGISVQDLVGTNTHINYASGLVPGLKVKIPIPPRKDEPMVDQHIQKYYPSIDMQTNYVQAATIEAPMMPSHTVQAQPVATPVEVVTPVPLKPVSSPPTKPNETIKVKTLQTVTTNSCTKSPKNVEMEKCLFHLNLKGYMNGGCQRLTSYATPYPPMEDSRFFFGPMLPFWGGWGGYPCYGYGCRPYGYGYGYGRYGFWY